MAEPLITHFDPEPSLLAPLLGATEYKSWNPETYSNPDWPGNILSKRAVIYGDGTIARQGDPVAFAVDPGELALCQRLSAEAGRVAKDLEVPGGTGLNYFGPFLSVARHGAASPPCIDPDLILARFGGMLFALAKTVVQPLDESGLWWLQDQEGCEPDEDYARQWGDLIRWFRICPDFIDFAYVRIGDNLENFGIPATDLPADVEAVGVVMPRLVVGLTRQGSLVGLSGCAVLA